MNRPPRAPFAGALALIATLGGAAYGGSPERFAGELRLREAVLAHVPAKEVPRLLLDEPDPNARHARFGAHTALEWGVPPAWLDVGPDAPRQPKRATQTVTRSSAKPIRAPQHSNAKTSRRSSQAAPSSSPRQATQAKETPDAAQTAPSTTSHPATHTGKARRGEPGGATPFSS